jgi:GNAT superfamily N-acetyltransferase
MTHPIPSQTAIRTDVSIRLAQPEDRAALEAIAAQTWEGQDYLPGVLDQWFGDPYGAFYVATLQDRVIGVAKLTRCAEDEWWMEGLRVDPSHRGRGVSRILHHFVMNQARQIGRGVIRFSTANENVAVHALARETGFERAAVYAPYGAEPLSEPVAGLWLLELADVSRVRAWLARSEHYAQAQRSLEWDWCFYFITDERLAERLKNGLVYGWSPDGTRAWLTGVLILNPQAQGRWPDDDDALKIAYLDAGAGDLAGLARDVRRLAAALGRAQVMLMALNTPERLASVEQAGYTREWDGEAWLYTRDLSLTAHAAVRTEQLPPVEK